MTSCGVSQEGLKRAAVKPSAEDIERFRQVSPIAHVDRVKAPLLFMLGAKDRRCAHVPAGAVVFAPKQAHEPQMARANNTGSGMILKALGKLLEGNVRGDSCSLLNTKVKPYREAAKLYCFPSTSCYLKYGPFCADKFKGCRVLPA